MSNKIFISARPSPSLLGARVFLGLTWMMACAWAQKAPNAALPASAPTPAPTSAVSNALTYRSAASPLTVGELAALQRKKLEQDFYKRAGFSTEKPIPTPLKSPTTPKLIPKAQPPRARHQLVVVGVYGPAGAERAEVRYDGATHVLVGRSRVGLITLEALAPGMVHVLAEHAGRPSRFALRPGQTLEVSE